MALVSSAIGDGPELQAGTVRDRDGGEFDLGVFAAEVFLCVELGPDIERESAWIVLSATAFESFDSIETPDRCAERGGVDADLPPDRVGESARIPEQEVPGVLAEQTSECVAVLSDCGAGCGGQVGQCVAGVRLFVVHGDQIGEFDQLAGESVTVEVVQVRCEYRCGTASDDRRHETIERLGRTLAEHNYFRQTVSETLCGTSDSAFIPRLSIGGYVAADVTDRGAATHRYPSGIAVCLTGQAVNGMTDFPSGCAVRGACVDPEYVVSVEI